MMERGAAWQSTHLINSKRRLEKKKHFGVGPPLAVFWLKSRGLRQSNWKSLKFGMSRHLFELRLWEKFLPAPESLLKNSVHLHSERRQWLDAEGQTDMIQGFIFFVSFFFSPPAPRPFVHDQQSHLRRSSFCLSHFLLSHAGESSHIMQTKAHAYIAFCCRHPEPSNWILDASYASLLPRLLQGQSGLTRSALSLRSISCSEKSPRTKGRGREAMPNNKRAQLWERSIMCWDFCVCLSLRICP